MIKPKIGISIGDPNGIGPEVIIKTLAEEALLNYCTPIVYGSAKLVSYHKNIALQGPFHFQSIQSVQEVFEGKINVVQCWQEMVNIELGMPTEEGGRHAYLALDAATQDLKAGNLDALVTGPIHKKAMEMAGFAYIGHTEYLAKQFDDAATLMMLVQDELRVAVVTGHVPVANVSALLTKERIIRAVETLQRSLQIDFGIERPVIAVLGLNPHAGDGGLIGREDPEIVLPAILACKERGLLATGPHPADGFFGSGAYRKADAILAMYHDQGLVPFKTLSFGQGVNFTAGLPKVRTSPDHGTAFDIAGKGVADPSSFRQALLLALDVVRQQQQHAEWTSNPLPKRETFRKREDY
jgi:4-hydroxythreonine-4-phosphate dehydrogenase